MSSTSPLPPAPNPQRRVPLAPPVLPRLLWRELHLLTPLWIAMYSLGAILIIAFRLTERNQLRPDDLIQTTLALIGFSSAIFYITSLLVTFSVERETQEDNFAIHRGFSPFPTYAVKSLLPFILLIALAASLFATGFIIASFYTNFDLIEVLEILVPTSSVLPTILWLTYLTIFVTSWTILCSLSTRKVIHALLLTCAAIIANIIYIRVIVESLIPPIDTRMAYTWTQQLFYFVLTSFPLIASIIVFHYRARLSEHLFNGQLFGTRPPKPIPLTTNPPPIEISTWKHLGWLHLREQYPLLIAAFVVIITAFIQPMLATYPIRETFFGNLEKYPFYIASCLFLLFSGTLTFSPEHSHSNYRFWSDRGLSPTLIFRSRMLRYSLILLTTLCISFILFTTTDAIINRNKSLLFAFYSGKLFHFDDDPTKTATLFITQYFLTAIPVGIFWSWICRQLIMSIVMTAFSMLFCFAYGNWASISNDWPYLVTHASFLIAIIACLWYLFPERFRLQPRTRLWLLPTLAAPLALFISIGDILIYRVFEVPSSAVSLAYHQVPIPFPQVFRPNYPPFADKLKSIVSQLKPAPEPPDLHWFLKEYPKHRFTRMYLRDGQQIDHDFEVECYGWNFLHPDLQAWTQKNLSLAGELQHLLLNTPIADMRVPIESALDTNYNLGSFPDLLIYFAKWKEHQGDLAGTLAAYTAADRYAEFMTMFNAAFITPRLELRARIARNLASYIAHPQVDRAVLIPFLRHSIDQLPETPDWSTQRFRTRVQLLMLHNQLLDTAPRDLAHITRLARIPTERWRFNRVLALWTDWLHNRNVHLLKLVNLSHYEYYSATYAAYERYTNYQRDLNSHWLQSTTPLFDNYQGVFDWLISPDAPQDDYYAVVRLTNAQARLLVILAERDAPAPITSSEQLRLYFDQTPTGTPSDAFIETFLRRHRFEIKPALIAGTPRHINSAVLGNAPDLALPLPDQNNNRKLATTQ